MGFPVKQSLIDHVRNHGLNPNVVLPLIDQAIAEGKNGVITSVVVTSDPATIDTLFEPTTIQFKAVVNATGGYEDGVVWSITGEKTGTTISPNGLLTLGTAQFEGTFNVTVTASSVHNDTKKGSVVVKCEKAEETEE